MSLTEDELLEVKLEEMKCEITHLEMEQEKLTAQLRTKEMQLDKTQRALEQVTQQLQVSPPHVVLTSSDENLQPFFFFQIKQASFLLFVKCRSVLLI